MRRTQATARTVQQEKQIARDILPEVQDAIKTADLLKINALKISRLEPLEQLKVAEQLSEGAKSYIDTKRMNKREEIHSTLELSAKYWVIYAYPPRNYRDKLTVNYGAVEHHFLQKNIAELHENVIVWEFSASRIEFSAYFLFDMNTYE